MKKHTKRVSVSQRKSRSSWILKGHSLKTKLNFEIANASKATLSNYLQHIEYRERGIYGGKEIPFLIRLRNKVKFNKNLIDKIFPLDQRKRMISALKAISRNNKVQKSIRKTAQETYLLLVA